MSNGGGSTEKALLGLLSIRPMSGYDVRQLIPWSIGRFWSESYGQIYPSLKRMTANGLVDKKTERQKGKPDRNVYSLTEEGWAELRAWLGVPVMPEVRRNELLLKLFFGAHVPAAVSREHVAAQREEHETALSIYAATAKKLKKEAAGDPNLPFWLMTLNMGRHHSRAMVAWCAETMAELDEMGRAVQKEKKKDKKEKSNA